MEKSDESRARRDEQMRKYSKMDKRAFGGGSPLVRGSGGSCNLVQEISFHIVKFS